MSWEVTVERWQLFEKLGFDSIWDCDHYTQPSRPTGPYFEGWSLLAALAAKTSTIRIGCLVNCNTFRHPALVAKMSATIDHISNGRLEVGLGAGWYVPEHTAYGIPFPAPGELVGNFAEAVEVIDLLLRNEVVDYNGKYYQLKEAVFRPQPLQRPRPPFTIGGHKPRMMRIVAKYAEAWNSFGTVDEMRERNEILDDACAAIGRDPAEIWRGLYGWAALMPSDPWQSTAAFEDMVGRYAAVGINEFIIDQPRDEQLGMAERIAADVIPRLRASTS
jgi:alkanesulfonate monooxygenase SsuD/methylene tetrahydromethanopterin reductase-like flavin-dependent oxidoreductase (luciferase family)